MEASHFTKIYFSHKFNMLAIFTRLPLAIPTAPAAHKTKINILDLDSELIGVPRKKTQIPAPFAGCDAQVLCFETQNGRHSESAARWFFVGIVTLL